MPSSNSFASPPIIGVVLNPDFVSNTSAVKTPNHESGKNKVPYVMLQGHYK